MNNIRLVRVRLRALHFQLKNQTVQHGQPISAEFKCMFSIVRRVSCRAGVCHPNYKFMPL